MLKKKKRTIDWKRWLFPSVIALIIVFIGASWTAGAVTGNGSRILIDLGDDILGKLIQMMDEAVRGERASLDAPVTMGGSTTRGDWNVEGDLSIIGSTSIATTTISTILNVVATSTASSTLQVDNLRFGTLGVRTFVVANTSSTAPDVCNYSIWRIAAEASTTFGLPDATSTIADCLTALGSHKRILVKNYSTSSDVDITLIAEDTRYSIKTIFMTATSSPFALNNDVIGTGNGAYLDFWNGPFSATSTVIITPLLDVD